MSKNDAIIRSDYDVVCLGGLVHDTAKALGKGPLINYQEGEEEGGANLW